MLMRYYFRTLVVVLILLAPWMAANHPKELTAFLRGVGHTGEQLASVVISHKAKTVEEIQTKYNATPKKARTTKVNILIVPGHEPSYGGAEFGQLKEREMVTELANELESLLRTNPRYAVTVTRDRYSWNPTFADYFSQGWEDIRVWQQAHKEEVLELIRLGQFTTKTASVIHNTVPSDVARRLYGIGKWANESDIDIVLHLHLNDYPRRNMNLPGEYSGVAIYVPEKEYYNSTTTKALADNIFKRLTKYNAVSDLKGEMAGIVEDQDLIAVGAYNSLNAASMLIEYGYIYEAQVADPELRTQTMKDMAYQTYLGLQDFFGDNKTVNRKFDTMIVPHRWFSNLSETRQNKIDVYALQTAFLLDGLYPPEGSTKNDCPRTGKMGPCTKKALIDFQKNNNITGEFGYVGDKTIQVLNEKFSDH